MSVTLHLRMFLKRLASPFSHALARLSCADYFWFLHARLQRECKKRQYPLILSLGGALLCTLLFVGRTFHGSSISHSKDQAAKELLIRRQIGGALQAYEKKLALLCVRLRRASPAHVPQILEEFKKSCPLVHGVHLEQTPQRWGVYSLGNHLFRDVRDFSGTRKVLITFSLGSVMDALSKDPLVIHVPHKIEKLSDLPRALKINSQPFSLRLYVEQYGLSFLYSFLSLIFLFLLLSAGGLGVLLGRRFWQVFYGQKVRLKELKHQVLRQKEALVNSEEQNVCFKKAFIEMNRLVSDIHLRYQNLANSVDTIHEIASTLLSEDLESRAAERDSSRLLKSVKTAIANLTKGYPVEKAQEEEIDVVSIWKQTFSIFLPHFLAKSVKLRVNFPLTLPYTCDPLCLRIVFYNLLKQLGRRFLEGHDLTISCRVKGKDGIYLSFQENGFTLPCDFDPLPEKSYADILSLPLRGLADFARLLGWCLTWSTPQKGVNLTTFYLPKLVQKSSNVLRLQDFKKHA
jgi:hypothetical protein